MSRHVAPGRPLADKCVRSAVPTDWQMFRDVNATEDWDGKSVDRAASLQRILLPVDDVRERRARRIATR